MKLPSLLVASLIVASLNAATSEQETRVVPSQYQDSYYTQTDDEHLAQQIRNALEQYQGINIRLVNGSLILTGYIDSENDRDSINDSVHNVDNTLSVEDRLIVKQKTPSKEDADLQHTIEQELKNNSSKETQEVRIVVLNGTVIITGTVENAAIRQQIKDNIRKLPGVKAIDDQMEVKHRDPKTVKTLDKYYLNQKRVSQVEISRPAFEDDHKTLDRVRDYLSSERYENVSAETYEDKIWLSGIVSTPSEKENLIRRVKQIEGVRQVDASGVRVQGKSYLW